MSDEKEGRTDSDDGKKKKQMLRQGRGSGTFHSFKRGRKKEKREREKRKRQIDGGEEYMRGHNFMKAMPKTIIPVLLYVRSCLV